MKIAYFVNQYPKVSHSFIRREILALERRGFEIQRISLRGWADSFPDPEDQREQERTRYVLREGPRGLIIPLLRAVLQSPVRLLSALRLALQAWRESDRALHYHLAYLAEACRMVPWLNASGARLLHAHFGTNSAEVAMLAHALGGPPYTFTVHGPEEFSRPTGLPLKVHHSQFVVAVSSFGRSQVYLRSHYGDWPKVQVIHCGLERGFYEGAAPEACADARLVCVGRLCKEKGQLLLIEAAARLVRAGVTFQLILAGDGPLRGALERLIRAKGLTHKVFITGWISSAEVRDQILAARALVLPSFAEGLPVVIMEAMALRRPVISTYIAGIPELVQDGSTGWITPAGSVDELARAMAACLSMSPQRLAEMGETARRTVLATHSIDIEVGKLAALFSAAASAAGYPPEPSQTDLSPKEAELP